MAKVISPEFLEFMTNKPNPPEHAAFMARALEAYPGLPAGAAQNALHCLETLGKGYARRYVANATARRAQIERSLMGTTLSAWRAKRADEVKAYAFPGVRKDSPKRKREEADRLARYRAHMRPAPKLPTMVASEMAYGSTVALSHAVQVF